MRITTMIRRYFIIALALVALGAAIVPAAKASPPANGNHTVVLTSDKGSSDNGQETHG